LLKKLVLIISNFELKMTRNDRQTSGNRSSVAICDRRRLRELIDQLNKLNARLQPFYALYCQYINEDPQFETTEV